MGFINLGRLNIRKRNSCASALVSLSDVQPTEVYKSHILNGPINKLYIYDQMPFMDGGGKKIEPICKFVPSIKAYTKKYQKIRAAYYKVNEAKYRLNPYIHG